MYIKDLEAMYNKQFTGEVRIIEHYEDDTIDVVYNDTFLQVKIDFLETIFEVIEKINNSLKTIIVNECDPDFIEENKYEK